VARVLAFVQSLALAHGLPTLDGRGQSLERQNGKADRGGTAYAQGLRENAMIDGNNYGARHAGIGSS